MMPELTAISLGWGLQSWTLAAMSALGELPPVDFAIHANTTWERKATYEFAEEWAPWLEERGVKVVTVDDREQARKVHTYKTDIPAFTLNELVSYGVRGQLRRQCTGRWKIMPIRRYISKELTRRDLKKTPGIVEQWIGITLDEWRRAKDGDVKYVKHAFPLLDLKMDRAACVAWLERHSLGVPVKSSCTFCPYHNKHTWQFMKRENAHDWKQAVEVDAVIRDKRPPYPLFVHPARVPLPEAVRIPEDFGATQLSLFDTDMEECGSGYCFL